MYVVIRRFEGVRSAHNAAQRARTGIGQVFKNSPGFRGYYVFDAGGGVVGSVTFFDTEAEAKAANEKALAWIRASLPDLIDGEPSITLGEVIATVLPAGEEAKQA